MKNIYFSILLIAFVLSNELFAQQYLIEGYVLGIKDNSLSFANVRVAGTTLGTSANSEGKYQLRLKAGRYKLISSYIGYNSDTVNIVLNRSLTEINFHLRPTTIETQEVIILPGKNPALEIITNAIRKKNERAAKLNSYEFFAFTKGVIRSDQNVTANSNSVSIGAGKSSDTTKLNINGIFENQSRGYYKKPDSYKEFITAQKQTSNFSSSINTLTGGRIIQNFYSNDIQFFNRPLPSPLADNALDYYYYYIFDTLAIDKEKVFKIYFEPDASSDPGFKGYIFITDSTFNLIKVDVDLNRAANMGGLFEKINIFQQFLPYENDIYMPIDYRLNLKANIFGLARIGFELNSVMYDYKINHEIPDDLFNKAILTVEKEADKKDSVFWSNTYSIPNTQEEIAAYKTIDSLQAVPRSFWDDFPRNLLNTRLSILDNIDINGPLSLYHFNRVEGHTLDFGLYSYNLAEKRLNSSVAASYGFSDKKFKTDFNASYLLGDYRTYKINVNAFNRMNTLFSESDNYNDLTSTVLALFGKYEFRDYYYSKGFDLKISGDVFPVLNLGVGFSNRADNSATVNTNFSFFNKNKKFSDLPKIYETKINSLSFSIGLDFRNYIEDGYYRHRTNEGKSFITFKGSIEISDLKTLKSNLDFKKYQINIDGTLNTFRSAKLNFRLLSIYSDGYVPYQLLHAMPGNLDGISQNWTFRTVRIGENFGDKYISLLFEHEFGDELFKLSRFPVLKDLELQLTAFYNIGWLDISDKSKSILLVGYHLFKTPLQEIGFNIGHLLFPIRLEFSWRLNHTEKNKFVIGLNTPIL